MLNRVVLVGRLTRDPDLRYTPNGVAVSNFTIACNRPFKNKDTGESEADFINCVAWRKTAESLANYQKKGSMIGVDGRVQSRTYDDKDGKKVYVTEVLAESIQFLESKGTQNNGGQAQQPSPYDYNEQAPKNQASQQQSNPFQGNGEQINILEQKNKRYREGLEFYADEDNYDHDVGEMIEGIYGVSGCEVLDDYGEKAQEALESESDD